MNDQAIQVNEDGSRSTDRRSFLRWIGAAGIGAAGMAAQTSVIASPLLLRAAPATRAGTGESIARLSSNENPYGLCDAARRAIAAGLDRANRYPIEEYVELKEALSEKHDLDPARIHPGAGSTELLRAAVGAYAAGGRLVAADPTYEDPFYYSPPFEVTQVRVPLDADGAHDLPAMERAASGGARLVYICNPNNPTGTIVDGAQLEAFIRRVSRKALVLVDEAYHDYIEDKRYRSMTPLVREGLPVVVTRTFSKIYGMAGLRLGYALCGTEELADRLHAHLTFAGASVVAIRAGLASLTDVEFQTYCRGKNAKARRFLSAALEERGYRVFPSHTNFVMFRLGTDVRELRKAMAARGVRIGRPFPPMTDHCRVSLGTMAELERFVGELDHWRKARAA
jgi:histidinol-phosphate aminotransferase